MMASPKKAIRKAREQAERMLSEARAEAAALLKRQVRTSYEAAKPSRGRKSWAMLGGSPAGDTVRDVAALRARSRDLYRNNAHAKAAIDILVRHGVGYGIRPRSTLAAAVVPGAKKATLKAGDVARTQFWKAWAETAVCDWYGRSNVYGLQALVRRTAAESGECLVRLRAIDSATMARLGSPIPLQLQVLEPDYLDSTRDVLNLGPTGGWIVGGIQFDADGRRVGYWLYARHPGDAGYVNGGGSWVSSLVPADQVLHVFKETRPGQPRGVPELHAAMTALQDMDDFLGAWMMRAKVEACLAAFVHDGADQTPPIINPDGVQPDDGFEDASLSPGAIIRLRAGQQVTTLTPSSNGGQVEYVRQALRSASASLGVGYDQVASDPSQASYSSLRAARIEFRRQVESDQWQMMVPQLCVPVWMAFCRLGTVAGLWPDLPPAAEWMPPSFDLLDPTQEVPAMRDAVRAGFVTPQQAIMSQGYDPTDQLAAIVAWNKQTDEHSVILDTDARYVSQQGQIQKERDGTGSIGAPVSSDGGSNAGE